MRSELYLYYAVDFPSQGYCIVKQRIQVTPTSVIWSRQDRKWTADPVLRFLPLAVHNLSHVLQNAVITAKQNIVIF